MAKKLAQTTNPIIPTRTDFLDNYIRMEGQGNKIGDVYVPAGTMADLMVIECAKHKACKCPKIFRLQGIVKKDVHSVGKPFCVDLSAPDETKWYGFDYSHARYTHPVSYSGWDRYTFKSTPPPLS